MFENVDLGTTVLRVSATDADSGLFAVIGYSLVDGEGKFDIKSTTVSSSTCPNNNNRVLPQFCVHGYFKFDEGQRMKFYRVKNHPVWN